MPDVSVIATAITTAGTLGGALGGVTLSNWTGIRREERQAQRQRAEARAEARRLAYADLLSTSTHLRVHVEITCQQHWPDLNVRLATAHEYTITVGAQAARSALLSAGLLADAALALGAAAGRLVMWTTANASLELDYSGPDASFLRGQVTGQPDFAELDARVAEFLRLASAALAADADETPATPRARRRRKAAWP